MTAAHDVTHHTIAIQHVEQILLGARRRGADTDALLRRAGIAPALLAAPLARVTQAQYAALMLVLRRALRDELWGLTRAPLPLGSFALGCRLLVGARTLGEALDLGMRHVRLLVADVVPRLARQGDVARLSVALRDGPGADAAQAYAARVVSFLGYGLACWLVARRVPLLAVDYPASAPGPSRDAKRLFQAAVHHDQPATGWRCDARWLELPVVQTPQSLRDFLRQAPASLLVRFRDHGSVGDRMRRILRRHLAGEMPSLDALARQLALTPQTLRRRLHDEGLAYRTLKDDLRRDAAIDYLSRPGVTLPEIAALLGYSEASTFHRAFKHWTGVAPGEYRQARLRGDG